MARLVICVTFSFIVGACEPAKTDNDRVYHGVMETGFELSVFHPDTGEGPWWFSAEDAIWDTLQQRQSNGMVEKNFFIAEVTFEGRVNDDGPFGVYDDYDRQVHATSLISHSYLESDVVEAVLESYQRD